MMHCVRFFYSSNCTAVRYYCTVLYSCTLLYCAVSDEGFVGRRFCRAKVLSDEGFVGRRFCRAKNLSGEGFVGRRFCRAKVLSGEGFVGRRFYRAKVLSGEGFIGRRFCRMNANTECIANSSMVNCHRSLNAQRSKRHSPMTCISLNGVMLDKNNVLPHCSTVNAHRSSLNAQRRIAKQCMGIHNVDAAESHNQVLFCQITGHHLE